MSAREKVASWRRTSIVGKLATLVLAVGLPLCAILSVSLYTQFQGDVDLAEQHAARQVNAIATRAEVVVEQARSLLAGIAMRPGIQAMDPSRCDVFLADLRGSLPQYTNMSTLDLEWKPVCSALPIPMSAAASAYPGLYERMKAADALVLSAPMRGRLSGAQIVIAAFPVKDAAGKLVGAATATLDLARLWPTLVGADQPEGYRARLIDAAGHVVMNHPDQAAVGMTVDPAADIAGARSGKVFTRTGADLIERINAYAPVRGSDWIAMAALPTKAELTDSVQRRNRTILAVVLAFLMAAWAAMLMARRITRPLRELEQDARVMAGGDFSHRSAIEGPDEVGQVAAAFNDMGRAVQRHETERRQAARESSESRQRLDGIIGSAIDAIVTVDEAGLVVQSNPAAHRMFGYAAAELLGQPVELILSERFPAGVLPPGDGSRTWPLGLRTMAPRMVRGIRRGGEDFAIEASFSHDESTGRQYSTAILRDVTEREKSDHQIRRMNRVHAVLTGINGLIVRVGSRAVLFQEACRIAVEAGAFQMAWIGVIDPVTLDGEVVALYGGEEGYKVQTTLTGRPGRAESEGPACRTLREGRPVICNDIANDPTTEAIRGKLLARGHRSLGCFPLSAGGKVEGVIALFSGDTDAFDEEEVKLLTALAGDISFALDHIGKQERIDYLALYDPLTGLANRTLFLERVGRLEGGAADAGDRIALFMLDIERFKNINSSLGWPAGDALLNQVAQWLVGIAGDADLVARLDGDRFALVMPRMLPGRGIEKLVERWMAALLAHPFHLGDALLRITAKVGVAASTAGRADAATLFGNAEAALKEAKAGGQAYLFHTERMTEAAAGKLALEARLREAVDAGAFALQYQPRLTLAGGKLASAEALLRWNDPLTGPVPAELFMPILEETGLIHQVGRWTLRQAIEDHQRWKAAGMPAVRIAINVSPLQFRLRGFIALIEEFAGSAPGAAIGLELEIAESLIMEDVTHSIASLKALRSLGVTVAIDDFGTGFSSLSQLARLPVDALKIDRSFIADMTAGPQGLALVSTFINLAHSLKLRVVAQGVDSEEQSRLLALLGCDEAQGAHLCEPLSSGALEFRFAGAQGGREAGPAPRRAREVPIGDRPPR